jgi:radical SAM superfamily enzyme YgiQ (UPF0313 family)
VVSTKSILYKDVFRAYQKSKPRVVGVSVVFYFQLYYALQIAKILKKINKKTHVVFGGPFVTKNIKNLINKKGMLEIIDSFIVGDGEEPLTQLLVRIDKRLSYSKIPNIYYKQRGRYLKSISEKQTSVSTLKTIPEFTKNSLNDYIPIRVSLGCYWSKCTFCSYCKQYSRFFLLTPEETVEQILFLIAKYKKRVFHFVDDSLPPKFLKLFSEILIHKKINISWTVRACVDKGFANFEIPKIMKKAGCSQVNFGIESMSDRILKLMNKMQTKQDVFDVLRSFKRANLPMKIFVMFGFISETKSEAEETLNFILECVDRYPIRVVDCEQFVLEEGTYIFDHLHEFGITEIDISDKGQGLRMGYRYKVKSGMTQVEVKKFVEKAYQKCANKIPSVFSTACN